MSQLPISSTNSPLELTGAQLRHELSLVMDQLVPYLDGLPDGDAWTPHDSPSARITPREAKLGPCCSLEETLADLFQRRINPSYSPASGGYLAYVPGGGIPHSAIADLIAGIVNKYVTVWSVAPGLANIEADVISWFNDLIGFPAESGGYLTTGGSMANWSAIVTARRIRLGNDFGRAIIYTSDQSHHSIIKAAVLAGFPETNVRLIPSDAKQRIELQVLRTQIAADRQSGFIPFLIAGHAGTTNTGAVDPLEDLAEIAKNEQLWLHIDAAYGGFFCLTKRGRQALRGLQHADSVTLDPHKGLFLPYGTGCLLVREQTTLRQAHHINAAYLPPFQEENTHVDFCEISPELSRDFRALRIWLPLKLFGWSTFTQYLDQKLDMCNQAYDQVKSLKHIEVMSTPQLSTFAFRLVPPNVLSNAALNYLNHDFLERINRQRKIFLSGTTIDDIFMIRISVLCFRTHEKHISQCITAIKNNIPPTIENYKPID
ncbi:MAG: aminotransferase class V-fold PLP-dependent enzyme [Planctomycetaceae bacterium]|jgi:aromatic-L-amino-acid/L-tryptophan decarboxylase|nr:aminotransferase class V-fold PLP-dependent enzyme [Planctomycetaceae bacterium]